VDERIDVIPAKSYQKALLDTSVLIEGKELYPEDVINATLQQVAKVSGQCVERGGLPDALLSSRKARLRAPDLSPPVLDPFLRNAQPW
jgi:hypothetical protein